jgi:hypothetical protein
MPSTDWSYVRTRVDAGRGVATFTFEELRDVIGAGRMTFGVIDRIKKSMAPTGLALVYDPDGPINQWASARVYDRNSSIGRFVEAAHLVGEEYDDQLREAVAGEATEIVDRIRALVCP